MTNATVSSTYAVGSLDPTNPMWTIDRSAAPNWDISNLNIFVDADKDRVVMTGLSLAEAFLACLTLSPCGRFTTDVSTSRLAIRLADARLPPSPVLELP